MTTLTKDKLKELALAATPGPWIKQVSNAERWSSIVRPVDGVWPYDNIAYIQDMFEDKCTHKGGHVHNAAYIAAASPDVVLGLLAEVERLKAELLTAIGQEQDRNFCQRCGKRTNDLHTCTPPLGFGKVLGTYGTVEKWPDTTKETK